MKYLFFGLLVVSLMLLPLDGGSHQEAGVQASTVFSDLTPDEVTFRGRRGTLYSVTWDPATYEFTFSTPDNTFPWDWIGFTGQQGRIVLNGHPDVGQTFAMSNPSALTGARPGDLIQVKGRGVLGLSHLTKIGLVVGSGANAQRAWFSQGKITEYLVAPDYVGYRVQVLGRNAEVRATSLNPQNYHSIGTVEVRLDDPSNARLIFASDLEPANDYSRSVEFKPLTNTILSYQAPEVIAGKTSDSKQQPVYVYASRSLQSWSAADRPLDEYLLSDSLDGQVAPAAGDGRVALSVQAQPVQTFYIGSWILAEPARSDPSTAWAALRYYRESLLSQLPVIDSLAMPDFKFVNQFSNLIYSYLVNPNAGLYYTDKAFIYLPDSFMPMVITPHLLPDEMLEAYRQGLDRLAGYQWQAGSLGRYGYRLDLGDWPSLPSWYGGNFPDILQFNADGSLRHRENYSDAYSTAEYINTLASYYRTTGDIGYIQSRRSNFEAAVAGLKAFDTAYDSTYGPDGNLFPNLLVPMGDLGKIAGEYPGETSQMIYALEDAVELWQALGADQQAGDLLNDFVTPMRNSFDGYFWNPADSFYLPVADQNSEIHSSGSIYQDFWAHTAFVPLRGDLGAGRLAAMLGRFTGPDFFEPGEDVHWLSKDSESFAAPGRWGLSPLFTNGWGMEGGYLVLPNVIPALGYYQLGQVGSAELYAKEYFAKWMQYGPHETLMEWDDSMPGKFGESSLYIEAVSGTTWLLQTALGLEIAGNQVTIKPRLSGQFVVRNLHVRSQGKLVVLDYARDAAGQETLNIRQNDGLTVLAPNATGPVPTGTHTPTSPPPTSTHMMPPSPTNTETQAPQPTPTAAPGSTTAPTSTATATSTVKPKPTEASTSTPTATEPPGGITGLILTSSSPTRLGDATIFTATVNTLSEVAFDWNFGDGGQLQTAPQMATQDGAFQAVLEHRYAEPGTYQVTVTAVGSGDELQAAALVLVYEFRLFLPASFAGQASGAG